MWTKVFLSPKQTNDAKKNNETVDQFRFLRKRSNQMMILTIRINNIDHFFAEPGIWYRNVVVAAVWKNSSKYPKYTHRKLTNWYPPGNDHISPTSRHFWVDVVFSFFGLVGNVIVAWRVPKHIHFLQSEIPSSKPHNFWYIYLRFPGCRNQLLTFAPEITRNHPTFDLSPFEINIALQWHLAPSANHTTTMKHPSKKPRLVVVSWGKCWFSWKNMQFMYRQHFQKKVDKNNTDIVVTLKTKEQLPNQKQSSWLFKSAKKYWTSSSAFGKKNQRIWDNWKS